MFQYRYVENETTGERYWIDKAVLTNEEGPSAEGGDWYEIDLQPFDLEGAAIVGLDLIDFGDGEVHITKNLDPAQRFGQKDERGRVKAITVVADVSGNTLKIQSESEGYCLNGWAPEETDKPMILRYLWDKYNATSDACGSGSQEAYDLHKKLDFAMQHTAKQCRDIVIREMQEDMGMYVGIDGAAGHDKELLAFYRHVLGLREENHD